MTVTKYDSSWTMSLHVTQSEKCFQINIVHLLFYASVHEFAHSLTVFPRINAAAFIKFFMIWVRHLFEGSVYSRAAFI